MSHDASLATGNLGYRLSGWVNCAGADALTRDCELIFVDPVLGNAYNLCHGTSDSRSGH
jgi:hypothetical protein